MSLLILKGGNALDIVHRISDRSSLDIDYSMSNDFRDVNELEEVRSRLFSALKDRFDAIGYVVFDERMDERPRDAGGPGVVVWGGYNASFKLLRRERYLQLGGVPGATPSGTLLEAMRREAQVTGIGSQRVFTIEISKFEFCEGSIAKNIDSYDCYVYTPAMISAEKLRAICQQLPAYTRRRNPAPRPRDFFDIHTIATRADCNLADSTHKELIVQMFLVKEVTLDLLGQIGSEDNQAFHAQQWPSVVNSVRGRIPHPFEFYFQYVSDLALKVRTMVLSPG